MNKDDLLERTRLQQAGAEISKLIKECKQDLEEARKEENSNITNEQIEAYCELGHSYVKELKEEYLRLEKELKNKEVMKRLSRSMRGGKKKKRKSRRKRKRRSRKRRR